MSSPPAVDPVAALERLDPVAIAADHGVVGGVLGAAVHGRRVVVPFGVARPGGLAVVRSTRFLVASVTKALVATVVAAAMDDGLLAPDLPVDHVLPTFGRPGITVGHLLTHTSGLPDQWPAPDEGPDALQRFVDGLTTLQLHAPPGERYGYTNAGYAVLGRLLEIVHGARFEAVMQRRLFDPLGVRATFRPADVPSDLVAVGTAVDTSTGGAGATMPTQGARSMAAAGGRLYATVDDLLTFGELHLSIERRAAPRRPLPSLPALEAMRRVACEIPDPRHGRWAARGLVVDDAWGTPVLLHDGGALGQSAYLRIVPADDAVLVLLAAGGVPQTFHRAVFAAVVPELLGRRPQPDVTADDSIVVEADRYVGRYTSPLMDVVVTADEAVVDEATGAAISLLIRPSGGAAVGPLPLRPVDDRLFLTTLDGRPYSVAFEPGDDGRSVAVLAGLRRLVRDGAAAVG